MFDNNVRSAHEPESAAVIERILAISEGGKTNLRDLKRYISKRDARLALDVDSSQLNFFLLEGLVEAFPKSRFLLTIRDCYSWLDSFINDSLRRTTTQGWIKLREMRFQAERFEHPPEESLLKEKGLYTLDGYLSYWSMHNEKVIATVPQDRLLIVKTREISARALEIAEFAGIPKDAVRIQTSHAFKNPEKFGVLQQIDQGHLQEKVATHCGELMREFFPEIRSLADAGVA